MIMKLSDPPNLFFFVLFVIFFSSVHSQVLLDSCKSPLGFASPLPLDPSSMQCVVAWPAQGFILRFVQTSPNLWSFVLSAPSTNAYVSIGFSPDGSMVGSTAVAGWGGNGSGVKTYYLGGKSAGLVRLQPPTEGLQLENVSVSVLQNRVYIAFQMMSNSPSTRLIYAIGPAGQLPSSPNFALSQHVDKFSSVLKYGSGSSETEERPEDNLKRVHGILNMVGWAIMIPVGAMVARYSRHWDPCWFYSHAMTQSIGFILGLIGVFCGLVLENRLEIYVHKHKALGVFILILGCLQVLAIFLRPYRSSEGRKYWNWYHTNVGRILIVLAIINVYYGIHLGKPGSGWTQSFTVVLVILVIITVILELRLWTRK